MRDELRAIVERLSALTRPACSPGERQAAQWIAELLRDRGVPAEVELERVHGTFWWPFGLTSAAGLVAALAGYRSHRAFALALGAAASATVFDEVNAGRRWLRRVLPKAETANALGRAGKDAAKRTVLVVAHHDAAHTSVFFDPRIARFMATRMGANPDHAPPPLMALVALAPLLAGVAGAARMRRLTGFASLTCAAMIAAFAEMALRPTVPGANDNLSGVATLVGIARRLQEQPVEHLRVLLLSTGAEESLMEGMRAFMDRHGAELSPEHTTVLCVDTVGSPELVLPDAEGVLAMRRFDPDTLAMVARCAEELDIPLRRGMRVRLGTDTYLALKRGIPSAMVMSVDRYGVSSNYHWPTDTAENVNYERVAQAVQLCEAVIRRLDDQAA